MLDSSLTVISPPIPPPRYPVSRAFPFTGVRLVADLSCSRITAAAPPGAALAPMYRKARLLRLRGQHQAAHAVLRHMRDMDVGSNVGGGRPADRSLLPVKLLDLCLESALNDFAAGRTSEALCGAVECTALAKQLRLVGHHSRACILAAEVLVSSQTTRAAPPVAGALRCSGFVCAAHVLARPRSWSLV